MAHKAPKKGAAAALSSSSPSSSSSSSSSVGAPSISPSVVTAAHTAPTSVWGKTTNPLTAQLPPTANGTSAAEKDRTALPAPAASPPLPSARSSSPAGASPSTRAAPAPSVSASSRPALSAPLQVGSTVSVTTALGEVLEGVVYVYDAEARVLALEIPKSEPHLSPDYSLLNVGALDGIRLVSPSEVSRPRVLPEVDHAKLGHKEERALAHRVTESCKIGVGVTARGQRMFDALGKLYGAAWQGTSIVLMDVMRLDAPYSAEQLTGGSQQQRQRIIKTIQAQQEREEQKTPK